VLVLVLVWFGVEATQYEAFKLCLSLAEAAPNLAASSSPVPLEALVSLCVRGLDDESPAARYGIITIIINIMITMLSFIVECGLEKALWGTGSNTGRLR